MKSNEYADYFRQKRDLHNKLERQLREELLKLEGEAKPKIDPDAVLREEIEAILQRYQFTPSKMMTILT